MRKIISFLFLLMGFLLNVGVSYAQNTSSQISNEEILNIILTGTPDDVKKVVNKKNVNNEYKCKTPLTMAIRSILSIQDLGDKSPLYAIEKLKYLISLGANVNQETCANNARTPLTEILIIPMEMQGLELIAMQAIEEELNNKNGFCNIAGMISKPCKNVTENERKQIENMVHQSFDETKKIFIPYLMDMIKILLSNGVDINKKDTIRNRTALHYAVEIPSRLTTEPLLYLIRNGANVNVQDVNGDTPLFFAFGVDNDEAVRILISAGADVNIRNNEGLLYNQVIGYQNYKSLKQLKNEFNSQ